VKKAEKLARAILARMGEVDANVSTSLYRKEIVIAQHGSGRLERQDEAPTGDDYNALWQAVVSEIAGAFCDLDIFDGLGMA